MRLSRLLPRPPLLACGAALALLGAQYSVVVWAGPAFEVSQLDLNVGAIVSLVRRLNVTTRCNSLPLAGNDGDLSMGAVHTWQTGYPMRTSYASGAPKFDPLHKRIRHQAKLCNAARGARARGCSIVRVTALAAALLFFLARLALGLPGGIVPDQRAQGIGLGVERLVAVGFFGLGHARDQQAGHQGGQGRSGKALGHEGRHV